MKFTIYEEIPKDVEPLIKEYNEALATFETLKAKLTETLQQYIGNRYVFPNNIYDGYTNKEAFVFPCIEKNKAILTQGRKLDVEVFVQVKNEVLPRVDPKDTAPTIKRLYSLGFDVNKLLMSGQLPKELKDKIFKEIGENYNES